MTIIIIIIITIIDQFANHSSARQYAKHIIESANENAHSFHREDILMLSSKKFSPDRITLILPFHPSTYPLRRISLKHYKTLMSDQDTNDIFKLLPVTSYKRERNLSNHFFVLRNHNLLCFLTLEVFLVNADIAINANLLKIAQPCKNI